jgi:hypothetical protein
MLNIFADALLIVARLGQPPEPQRHRLDPRWFQDLEGLRTGEALRNQAR